MKNALPHLIKCSAAVMLLPLLAQAAPDPNFHIYLLLGQSNMQGAGHLPDTPISHDRVQVLQGQNCSGGGASYGQWREHYQPIIRCKEGNRTKPDGSSGPIGLSPADMFAVTMADNAGPNITIGLVGAAYGGTQIESHLPDCSSYNSKEGKPTACTPPYGDVSGAPVVGGTTPIYNWIVDLAKKAQEKGVIKGIIFHHGESSSGESTWLPRVNQYISSLRKDLGLSADEVPFIAGELPYTGCCANGHNPLVRQIPDYVENGHWVSAGPGTDGKTLGDRSDNLHWSTASVIEMGKRYAAKMIEVGNYGPVDCGTTGNTPICCNIKADPDGDGNGTQNDDQACKVTENTIGWHPANPSNVVAAINVGGSGDAVPFGDIWFDADTHFTGGEENQSNDTISGANGSSVYSSERFGDYSYAIPVTNGEYSIELGMVELYQTADAARSFNVSIEGQNVISNMDIHATVGHDKVLFETIEAQVNDGSLDIEVTGLVDNGTLSSILVRKQGSTSTSSSSSSSSSASSTGSNNSSGSQGSSDSTGGTKSGALSWLMTLILGFGLIALGRQHTK